jgi:hypothetical protein
MKTRQLTLEISESGQCEVLGKSTSLLGFQPPTSFTPLPDSQSLKGFQCKAFRHFVKMSDRELRTLQLTHLLFLNNSLFFSYWTVRSSRKINEFTRVSAPNVLHPSSRLTIAERLSMQGF